MRHFILALGLWTVAATPLAAQPASLPREAYDRLAQADANSDGLIARDEFLRYRAGQFDRMDRNGDDVLSPADSPPGPLRFAFDPDALIAPFDANGDGRVTRAELTQAPTPAFDAADRNGDNLVDEAELRAARAQRP